ncbi:hypothetical protein HYC85_011928 [Camellia sinensis]|uniref:histidine kinase n=1 Tax=Camellia sinensis TaxID=4442 RepID=A0A7J7HBD4_CAMSI|nr:hypothetical protein HYC85_011928 [Camellia sinensis]
MPNQRLYTDMLGYVSDSGKAALEKLKPPHNSDACFMDLQMPEMDGFEATGKIRSLEREVNERIESGEATIEMFANVAHWHTPILAMTADVIQATNEECMKCGMDDYVSKPFAEEQLYSAVARFFESGLKALSSASYTESSALQRDRHHKTRHCALIFLATNYTILPSTTILASAQN